MAKGKMISPVKRSSGMDDDMTSCLQLRRLLEQRRQSVYTWKTFPETFHTHIACVSMYDDKKMQSIKTWLAFAHQSLIQCCTETLEAEQRSPHALYLSEYSCQMKGADPEATKDPEDSPLLRSAGQRAPRPVLPCRHALSLC